MPWKEPGNSSNNKDPWTGRPKQTPPDLEAILRGLRKKIAALFKLKAFNKNTAVFTKVLPTQLNTKTIGLIFSVLVLAWLLSGFFTVNASEQAVITRFGKYHTTLSSGRHWIFRPIETRYIISEKNTPYSYQINLLTQDKNKVSVATTLHYTIANARQYLFSNTQPLQSLQEALANTINKTLGQITLEKLLTTNLFSLQQSLQAEINKLLDNYETGLAVNDIEIQPIQIPEELKAAFEDVTNAELEKKQLENQAKVYAIQIEPNSKEQSERLIADAKNYQQEVILNAKAETARFLALLPTYEASPELMRKRLYLEAMQTMMAHSNKMLIDNPAHTSLYLNIDKSALQSPEKKNIQTSEKSSSTKPNTSSPPVATEAKTDNRLSSSYDITGGYE